MRFCGKAGGYRWTKKSSMLVGGMLQVDRKVLESNVRGSVTLVVMSWLVSTHIGLPWCSLVDTVNRNLGEREP